MHNRSTAQAGQARNRRQFRGGVATRPAFVAQTRTPLLHLFRNAALLPLLLVSMAAVAMPLPKILIAEQTLADEQATLSFDNIDEWIPGGSQHLVIEMLAASIGDDEASATVTLTFNGDQQPGYTGRSLFAEGRRWATDIGQHSHSAGVMSLPRAGGQRFGGGYVFIPWAFLHGQDKHLLAYGAANEDRYAMHMAHWASPQAIASIQLGLSGSDRFAAGSRFRLYVVDERMRLRETVLADDARQIEFADLPQHLGHLIVIGQTRSSENNPRRNGDRVWQAINGDRQRDHYRIQRLTGEAAVYRDDRPTPQNLVHGDQMAEPRIGWNSADAAPAGVFGPWWLFYPDYADDRRWKTFFSRHGARDNHYNPIGNEIGYWADTAAINSLRYHPQAGRQFKAGSRAGLYHPGKPWQRHVVGRGGEQVITLEVAPASGTVHLLVTAHSEYDQADEDRLLIRINDDDDADNYLGQRFSARDRHRESSRGNGNEIGILPAAVLPADRMGSTYIALMGAGDDDRQTALLSHGGVAGDGSIAFYGGRWQRNDAVVRVSLRTKSGAAFSAGSTVDIWMEGGPDRDQVPASRWRSAAFAVVAIALVLLLAWAVLFGFTGARTQRRD